MDKEFMLLRFVVSRYHCIITVSYTHLDVYKRQLMSMKGTNMPSFIKIWDHGCQIIFYFWWFDMEWPCFTIKYHFWKCYGKWDYSMIMLLYNSIFFYVGIPKSSNYICSNIFKGGFFNNCTVTILSMFWVNNSIKSSRYEEVYQLWKIGSRNFVQK